MTIQDPCCWWILFFVTFSWPLLFSIVSHYDILIFRFLFVLTILSQSLCKKNELWNVIRYDKNKNSWISFTFPFFSFCFWLPKLFMFNQIQIWIIKQRRRKRKLSNKGHKIHQHTDLHTCNTKFRLSFWQNKTNC